MNQLSNRAYTTLDTIRVHKARSEITAQWITSLYPENQNDNLKRGLSR